MHGRRRRQRVQVNGNTYRYTETGGVEKLRARKIVYKWKSVRYIVQGSWQNGKGIMWRVEAKVEGLL